MSTLSQPSSPTPGTLAASAPQSRRPAWRLFWIVVLALGLLLVYKGVRITQIGWTAYRIVTELRAAAQADPSPEMLPELRPQVEQLAIVLDKMAGELRPFNLLLRWLDWLPIYGPTLAAAPDLLVAGKELTALAGEGLALIEPALSAQDNRTRLRQVVAALVSAESQVAALATRAETAQQALATVPVERLHPLLAENLAKAQPLLPLLAPGLRLAPSLPRLLGFEDPATYMILVQNNDELRATGGFISAIGTLRLENVDIAGLDFADSYAFTRQDLQYPSAPPPMQRYMNIPLMLLRDANWSPDLPTSARLVKAMYTHDTGTSVQGLVTIDLRAVELIFAALAPLHLEGSDEPITDANVLEQVKQLWTAPTEGATIETVGLGTWWGQRKDFIPLLANSALQRLQGGEVHTVALVRAALQALNERAIQVWVDDPDVAAQLARLGWDGGLHPVDTADFLALVDTNMGYNKVDAVIERALRYTVTWPHDDEPAHATATITYTHPLSVTDEVCAPIPRYDVTYEDLTERCYFNYIRLYAPLGSKLVAMEGVQPDSVSSQRGEASTQVFAGYFMLQPGKQHTVTVQYTLPAHLTPANYSLIVQRQSGLRPLPLEVDVEGRMVATTLASGRFAWNLVKGRNTIVKE